MEIPPSINVLLNELPDELVLKIFSLLPMFEETLATRLVSKRWKGPWKLLPDVKLADEASYNSFVTDFMSFVYGSLLSSNSAQNLERFHLKLSLYYSASEIDFMVRIAVYYRSVRELRIDLLGKTLELPSCLSNCTTLKTLILNELRVELVPNWFCLPSLKTLHLLSVKFSGHENVASLLRICPVLEDLVVNQTHDDVVLIFDFYVPTLKSLSINLFGKTLELSSFLSTCATLETLILNEVSIKLVPQWSCFPSLKTLHLLSVKFSGHGNVANFLQICPVLEDLVVNQTHDDAVMIFDIIVPTLKSLSINLLGKTLELSSCLNSCTTLQTLILNEVSIKLVPHWFCLPSLKTLHLSSVKFSGHESIASLLRICPVLEDLVVNQRHDDIVMIFDINVPTLKSLSIDNSRSKKKSIDKSKKKPVDNSKGISNHGFVIKAPSLTNLNVKDTFSNFIQFEYMPEVTKANIEVIFEQSDKFIGSLPSIQHLSLCSLTSKSPYPIGTSFSSLEHLELCTCSAGWWDLLACLLNDAPKLRSLKLKSQHRAHYNDPMKPFNEPTDVPECLLAQLEILEWRQYEGTEQEREVAAYILANATRLKMATFSTRCRNKHHRMLKKLKSMNIVSKTCQLVLE